MSMVPCSPSLLGRCEVIEYLPTWWAEVRWTAQRCDLALGYHHLSDGMSEGGSFTCNKWPMSLISGIPCWTLCIGSELPGAIHCHQSERIFRSCPCEQECNAFSILTKHLSCTVAVTFAVWGETAKSAQISFFPHNTFTDKKFILTVVDFSNLSMQLVFSS